MLTGDALAVEVSEEIDVVEVCSDPQRQLEGSRTQSGRRLTLDKDRSVQTNALDSVRLGDRGTVRGGVQNIFMRFDRR